MPEVKLWIYKEVITEGNETYDLSNINELEIEGVNVVNNNVVDMFRERIVFDGDNVLVYDWVIPFGDIVTSFGYWVDVPYRYRITLYTDKLSNLTNLIDALTNTGLLESTLVNFGGICECECK